MKKSGFTLIELLVVIAIIAILAAILFPVFAQAKVAAKKAVDISNNKQEDLAFQMYATDVDDTMPIAFPDNNLAFYTTPWDRVAPANALIATRRQDFWTNSTQPYKKNYGIDAIPVATTNNLFGIPATANPMNYVDGYTYNTYLQALSDTSFTSSAATVVLWPGDGSNNWFGYGDAQPLWYMASVGFPSPGNPAGLITFQNSGPNCVAGVGVWGLPQQPTYWLYSQGFNMAYADGHAKFVVAASGNSPWASVDAQGHAVSYWVNSVDAAAGCAYDYILSPFFPGN